MGKLSFHYFGSSQKGNIVIDTVPWLRLNELLFEEVSDLYVSAPFFTHKRNSDFKLGLVITRLVIKVNDP